MDYFEAPPDTMPTVAYAEHHILINLADLPVDTENYRDGQTLRYDFARNELVITPVGVVSGWRWHQQSKVIVVLLEPEELDRFARQHLGLLLTEQQLKDVPRILDADLTETAELLLGALQDRTTGFEVLYEAHSRIFLVKLLDRYGDRLSDAVFDEGFSGQHYKRMLDCVRARFGEALTVEDLAAAAGLSATAFAKEFKRVIGETPYRFLMIYRVERAQEMLEDISRPMIDIAMACGFSDQAHFSRTFKSVTSETPRQYRTSLTE